MKAKAEDFQSGPLEEAKKLARARGVEDYVPNPYSGSASQSVTPAAKVAASDPRIQAILNNPQLSRDQKIQQIKALQ